LDQEPVADNNHGANDGRDANNDRGNDNNHHDANHDHANALGRQKLQLQKKSISKRKSLLTMFS
jgi:hypothetical protein